MCLNCHYFCACVLSCLSLNPLIFSTIVCAIFVHSTFSSYAIFLVTFLLLCRLFPFLLYLSPQTQLAFPHLQLNANLYTCIYYDLSYFFLVWHHRNRIIYLINLTMYYLFHTYFFTTNNSIFNFLVTT